MSQKRCEMKAKLLQEAEAVLDELLEWEEQTDKPDFSQIEAEVLRLRQRLSEKMAAAVIEQQEEGTPVPGPACPMCGQELRTKGKHRKTVSSWIGEIELKRLALPVQAGMRWSRTGFERPLPIRAAILSHSFDDVWDIVHTSPII